MPHLHVCHEKGGGGGGVGVMECKYIMSHAAVRTQTTGMAMSLFKPQSRGIIKNTGCR